MFRAFCDLDWIQTSNLLSRNQVRYSVAPQGHCFARHVLIQRLSGCKYRDNCVNCKSKYVKK